MNMEAVHDEDEASTQQCDTMSEENCDSESDREWSEDEQEKERSSTGHAERLPSSSGESKNVPSAAPSASKTTQCYTPIIPTLLDVLSGRGPLANNHPGNVFFRQESKRLRPSYLAAPKNGKTDVALKLIKNIHERKG
mmetsp:Transcript_18235/g.34822  ORF Transcript_18235/g.34822 Transcript_18235/m.34822 type:complete len:138 (+) Transcript_18235:185-598(+)